MVLILSDEDVRSLLTMKDCIGAIEEAYREMALGTAVNAPRRDTILPTTDPDRFYQFKTIEGGLQGLQVFAQRINSDMLTWPIVEGVRRRVKLNVAPGGRYVGLIFLYSMKDLQLLTIVQDGELQRMRVGAASAVGAQHLAPRDAEIMGLLGAGWQAGAQVEAMTAIRKISKIKVFSPNRERREAFAAHAAKSLGVEVVPVNEPSLAVEDVDIVDAATNSEGPVCRGEWLRTGTHLTCIKPLEFDDEAWDRANKIVFTSLKVETYTNAPAELASRLKERSGQLSEEDRFKRCEGKMHPITDLLLGKANGRMSDDEITLMYKGIGLGIEFAAPAKKLYDLAKAKGVGKEVPSEWFTQTSHP